MFSCDRPLVAMSKWSWWTQAYCTNIHTNASMHTNTHTYTHTNTNISMPSHQLDHRKQCNYSVVVVLIPSPPGGRQSVASLDSDQHVHCAVERRLPCINGHGCQAVLFTLRHWTHRSRSIFISPLLGYGGFHFIQPMYNIIIHNNQ